MSAPTEPFSSVSSSGHVDGLGRRSLAFDRETGAMLEKLYVRPELAVFEQIVRGRVDQIAKLEEERIARPLAVERDSATGELVVIAEFITGSRLSELLEVSADAAIVPGVDVALGYLLEVLPALISLHGRGRIAHGLIDPSRTIVTEAGQVVFLDAALGPAVEMLHLSPHRLWAEFGIAVAGGTSRVSFDPAGDVTQASLSALMLVLGRSLRTDECPDALPGLLQEVIEVAQIRGSTNFATGLQRFLQRALPLPGRRPFNTADEALAEVRQLVRREIGLDVCRQAVTDFVTQMDGIFAARETDTAGDDLADEDPQRTQVPELDRFLDAFDSGAAAPETGDTQTAAQHGDSDDGPAVEDDGAELEISLDQLEVAPPEAEREEIFDLTALDDPRSVSSELASLGTFATPPREERRADTRAGAPGIDTPPAPVRPAPAIQGDPPVAEALRHAVEPSPAPIAHDEPPAVLWTPLEAVAPPPAATPVHETTVNQELVPPPSAEVVATPELEAVTADAIPQQEEGPSGKDAGSGRRRKRQQQKSARARKDKLRSASDGQTPPPPAPPPPPPRPASPSGWLVSPHRAAAEALANEPVFPPAPVRPPSVPVVPSFAPTPVGQVPQPTYATPATPVYGTPSVLKPPAPPPPPPVAPVASGVVKLKPDPSPTIVRKPEPEPLSAYTSSERFTTLSLGRPEAEEPSRSFPWRLAAVAVAVAVVAVLMGRTYLPGRTAVIGEPGAAAEEPTRDAAPSPPLPKPDSPVPTGRGRINIQTQPAGLRVLLDRKPIGETPLQIDATPGRHVLTFITSGGEVMHSVRVVAGKTVDLDIPVFSGWVSVIAPIVLNISEDGRSLGTTEQNRLMLPPGRHKLTLTNTEFGYSSVHDVDVEPGAVRSLTINARGSANLNAQPWAEVWLDGTKLGDTPLAGAPVPLGLREFIFKHPQFGERRVSATITANTPAVVTVDFTK